MHPQLETSLALVETVSQKLYLSGIGYYCLFPVYLEEQLPFDIRDNVFQRLFRTCFASAEDDQIIGYAARIFRDDRELDCQSLTYRMYLRLWQFKAIRRVLLPIAYHLRKEIDSNAED